MQAISSYCGNRPTNTHTQTYTPTDRTGPITIHCTAKLSVQCNNSITYTLYRGQSHKTTAMKHSNKWN